jgi:acetyl esterase/lipase
MSAGRWALAAVVLAVGGLVGLAPARDDRPAPAADGPELPPLSLVVEKHADIAYRDGPGADRERHKLDVYVPKGRKDFPVLLFVHGGSWRSGNKNLYTALGNSLARAGIGVVITNYRLSPQVKHPAHVEDVARAFAWTCANVGRYGGRADHIYVCGHSAGGHLVSLLATDPNYLKAENRSPADIRGVIAISGVYEIRTDIRLFQSAFGADERLCRLASPLTHVTGKHPPFLIAYGDSDLPYLDRMAEDMHAALTRCGCPSTLLKLKNRNHYTIIMTLIDNSDPLHKAVREFVK